MASPIPHDGTPGIGDATFSIASMPRMQRMIFPERIDKVLEPRFNRENQGLTASFLGTGKFLE